jgi:beta-hydroxyacyl-ACP dehydratase FabZ
MERRVGEILRAMPHRYPFLLVDRILRMEGKKRIEGIKNVTVNEPFFVGHFPHRPVMPGVLIVEALGQLGGYLFLASFERPEEKVLILSGLEKARFYRPVVPGDQLKMEMTTTRLRETPTRTVLQMQGRALVDEAVVAEVTLSAFIVDRDAWQT